MRITKQNRREAKQLYRFCLVSGLLDEKRTRQIVEDVLAAKPRGYLAILTHFKRLVKLDVDRRAVRVESTVPLSAPLLADFQANLTHRYGAGLEFTFAQNPALLGGVRVRVGNDVYDGSIQARLNSLMEQF